MKKYLLTVSLFFLGVGVFAQVSFSMRFYDKKVYYVQGSKDEPIRVLLTIANNNPYPFYFKIADDRAFSIDFDVRTTMNRPLPQTDLLLRKRAESGQVYFRTVSIEPGESFSFVEDIREYASLLNAGAFVVQAKLYPELFKRVSSAAQQSGASPIVSNRLILNIRPPTVLGEDGVPVAMDVETNAILVREKLSPDQMITYVLTARQKSQWEKFFLYMDLKSMILRDDARRRQWNTESEEGRLKMLTRYRAELQESKVDGDIVVIPMKFDVQRVNYGVEEGTVVVLEWFQVGGYVEKKQYTYNIQRQEDVWMIVNYTVQNLGTE
ncbi:MAG: hypothetical protein LBE74_09995 [Treponema sp.]|jgi:hypothetical protein|nr:hypothetical protein [Treponema sp.]